MTPEKADAVLKALLGAIGSWIEEAEEFQDRCPEAKHLLAAMRQGRTSLTQLIARDHDPL